MLRVICCWGIPVGVAPFPWPVTPPPKLVRYVKAQKAIKKLDPRKKRALKNIRN